MNMQQNSLSKVKTILNRLKHTPGDGGRSDEMETQQVSNPQIQRNNQLSNAQTGGYANLWEQMAGETLTIPGLNSKPKKPRKQLDQNYRIKIRTPGMKVAPLDKTSSNKVTITISTAKNGRHVRKFKAAQEPESSPAQQPDKRSKKADKSKHL